VERKKIQKSIIQARTCEISFPFSLNYSKKMPYFIFIYSIMLSNFDLEGIAQHYNFPLSVLMKDELVNRKPKSGKYIINLQSSTSGNETHWLSMEIRGKNCFYMDSFGIIHQKKS
jgi:hypothetical protein